MLLALPAQLCDAEAVHNDGRTRREKPRQGAFEVVFAPQHLPLDASRQESTEPTPSVTTLPSATVGEHLGPWKPEAGPLDGPSCILVLPEFFARGRIETAHDFIPCFTAKDEQFVAN